MVELEHMSNPTAETCALKNPHSIQREFVLKLHASVMDGFKYEDKKDGFMHQTRSERGKYG